ncbi:putative RNA-directed DNA polymerase [Tanacetum coccineum]
MVYFIRLFVLIPLSKIGVAERKHRHLLNVARALMFQRGIPFNMWIKCILTAVYLIKRLSSSVLFGKSPYELLFKIEPNLSHLKTFGCLCFSTVLNDSDKFSSRFEKLVFIGYSNDKKSYKLYSFEIKKVIYSGDVKFYETVFPFKNSAECKEDKETEKSKGINYALSEDTENTDFTRRDETGHHDDSESAEAFGNVEENAILDENNNESEGDDSFYQEFNEMFQTHDVIPDSQSDFNPRRSSRKTSMPKKLSDFKTDTKVKYSIDK